MKKMIKLLFVMTALYTHSDTTVHRKEEKPNRLIEASSPYLRQHAYNLVDWYEWGAVALEKAKKEDKPILVSIGYSSCHWCHVMAHESFENEDIARIMNEHFISIKVDREERPDIDRVYMDAVHAMGMQGGWPLNVFTTPDGKPFYGGTYFPTNQWAQVLIQISKAYKEKRSNIDHTAAELTKQLAKSEISMIPDEASSVCTKEGMDAMYKLLETRFDSQWGGMGTAPKFIMPAQWLFLLRYHHKNKDTKSLYMVEQTLNKIAMGGIYDQVGGGFARYSVDEKWFAPHFEKMLYDNAQLVSLYSEAYTLTGNALYKRIVYETMAWLKREMTGAEGGFYSALDADSQGKEGEFYVWTKEEFDSLLQHQPDWVAHYYSIEKEGNWEDKKNILFIKETDKAFATKNHITPDELDSSLKEAKKILLKAREQRIKPGLDDKILTGWNAMMLCGLIDAYNSFGDPAFLELAKQAIRFLEKTVIDEKVYRSFREKRSPVEGFMEDYAFLIQAYIALYQVTFNEEWIRKAERWTNYVHNHFFDEKEGFYYLTADSADSLIVRKKEIFDNVIPASNGVMARNLYHLGILLDKKSYTTQANQMMRRLSRLIASNPSYMSYWGILYAEMVSEIAEVVIVGKGANTTAQNLRMHYTPFSLFMGTESQSELPLVKGKKNTADEGNTIYVCYNKTCKLPVHTIEDAMEQLTNR